MLIYIKHHRQNCMKKNIFITLVVIYVSINIFCSSAFAQSAFTCSEEYSNEAGLLSSVTKKFDSISSLKADFEQRSILLGFNQSQSSKGQLVFKKVGMMDWHYLSPEEQRFITDGKTVWFYQKALNQVAVTNFKNTFSTDLPVSFLLGLSSLDKEFNLVSACKSHLGLVLKLNPIKKDPNLSKFELVVDVENQYPQAVKITDVGGNDTEIILRNVERNSDVDSKRFQYQIPRGVDVIQNQ